MDRDPRHVVRMGLPTLCQAVSHSLKKTVSRGLVLGITPLLLLPHPTVHVRWTTPYWRWSYRYRRSRSFQLSGLSWLVPDYG